MIPVFKPSDFTDPIAPLDHWKQKIADQANAKIQKLRDEAPIAYKYHDKIISYWNTQEVLGRPDNPTHKARLMFIEEIKKEPCKHEPVLFSINAVYRPDGRLPEDENYICKNCGVSLQMTWSERKQEMSNWIKISEKKPEDGQYILAKFKHGIIDCAWDEKSETASTYVWRDLGFYVDAWMPLELAKKLLDGTNEQK
jgi:hypothetical protein